MNILTSVQQFLTDNNALNGRFIVAVSGGKDSMALLHICKQLKLNIIAAHCNFMLRGNASMLDESFITGYCNDQHIIIETRQFNTKEHSEAWGLSTQETARKLRYEWFETLRNKHGADFILTAHHANDVAETFLLNLLRGSGLKGLRSIPAINGAILRPLLLTPVTEIETYIAAANIPYRDDASNSTDIYRRNYVRHRIIPLLNEVNNQALNHIMQTTALLSESYQLLREQLSDLKGIYTTSTSTSFTINLAQLFSHPQKKLLLYEWLTPFGFNASSAGNIIRQMPVTGSTWLSDTHIALYDRGKLIVTLISKDTAMPEIHLTAWPTQICFGEHTYELTVQNSIPELFDPNTLYLDNDTITFPIKLRVWQHGDVFRPLGMKQDKKVSDFFIDEKVNMNEKKQAMIIEGEKGIIAVAPYRISDLYKVTPQTRNLVVLTKLA